MHISEDRTLFAIAFLLGILQRPILAVETSNVRPECMTAGGLSSVSVWYQMAFPKSIREDLRKPVKIFQNNLLMWKHNGLVSDLDNYISTKGVDISVERVCPIDRLTLKPQKELIYVVDQRLFGDVVIQDGTKHVEYNDTEMYDETLKSLNCNRKPVDLTFPSVKSLPRDFFDPDNWVLCQEDNFCNDHLEYIDPVARSYHPHCNFPLDVQRIPSPGSQFWLADKCNTPDLSKLSSLHEEPYQISSLQSVIDEAKKSPMRQSQKIAICDDSLTEHVCSNVFDIKEPKCDIELVKPKCSCRSYCGILLQTTQPHDEVADLHDILDSLLSNWNPKHRLPSKNLAIIQNCSSKDSCVYTIQLVYNETNRVDLRNVTRVFEKFNETYILTGAEPEEEPIIKPRPPVKETSRLTTSGRLFIAGIVIAGLAMMVGFLVRRFKVTRSYPPRVQMANIQRTDVDAYGNTSFQRVASTDAAGDDPGAATKTSKFFTGKDRNDGFHKLNSSTLDLMSDVEYAIDDEPVMFDSEKTVTV